VKLVTAVLRPETVEDVREALRPLGQFGMTMADAQGCGRQKGHSEVYRGTVFRVDFLPKARLEMVVADEVADRVVEAIVQTVRTGNVGDGKIWVTPVETVVRVRTGEGNTDAL
jgi:nitrogen regulatory protein P-II 1